MLALMKSNPEKSWFSKKHDDGTMFKGMFIAGMNLPSGTISYHFNLGYYEDAKASGAREFNEAPQWDGHSSDDVLMTLREFVNDKS